MSATETLTTPLALRNLLFFLPICVVWEKRLFFLCFGRDVDSSKLNLISSATATTYSGALQSIVMQLEEER
jgi:hypothetical protein